MGSTPNAQKLALGVLIALTATAVSALVVDNRLAASRSVNASAAALPPVQPAAAVAAVTANTITVVGQGSAQATPDQATVGLGVDASRATIKDALAAAAVDTNNLLNALHAQGVQDKDMQTATVSVSVDGPCCPRNVTGYEASNQVTVTVHHLGNVGAILTASVDAVGNDLQLSGVSLSVSDTSAAVSTARTAAMADATARAKQWVGLAGRHLGRILAISEAVTSAIQPVYAGGYGAGGGGVQINPGQTTIGLTITVVYELLD